ncbi:hypothetical protein V1503_09735 [Bacillus sp. SCS-151]|uniref:hypothetical protein n=1 Tax=Bacillaceae TaxID=186817 RepID=UPI002A0DCE1A|nr:hypothetical protein [Cytobacillus sp. IB215665]MDX8367570.1 hypothetical protein [Cytobacillus sp. IB215665]
MYTKSWVKKIDRLKFAIALGAIFLYNSECWSLTAMMWKVADTPGRFAMASVGKFPRRMSIK